MIQAARSRRAEEVMLSSPPQASLASAIRDVFVSRLEFCCHAQRIPSRGQGGGGAPLPPPHFSSAGSFPLRQGDGGERCLFRSVHDGEANGRVLPKPKWLPLPQVLYLLHHGCGCQRRLWHPGGLPRGPRAPLCDALQAFLCILHPQACPGPDL